MVGTIHSTGTAFPTSPADDDLFLFNATASNIAAKDYDGTTNITTARRGDVFKYDGTDWVKQSANTGTTFDTGTTFPSSPQSDDLFGFNDTASSIVAKDYNGTDDITSAVRGDIFKYDGTDWVKQKESGLDQDTVDSRVQMALEAAVTSNTETGIVVTYQSDGTLDFVVGGAVGAVSLRFGTSDDATPEGTELTIAGSNNQGTIPAYSGGKHHLIARLSSESDITSVLYSDDQSQTNQIGAFTEYGSTVAHGTDLYNVWVSNQLLTQTAAVIVTVA